VRYWRDTTGWQLWVVGIVVVLTALLVAVLATK
jgi:hypothetical protein